MKGIKTIFTRIKALILNEYPRNSIAGLYTRAPMAFSKIPNIVYQTWNSNVLGRTHYAELKKFREMNLDYSFELYDNARMDGYMREYYGNHKIFPIYENSRFGPLKTDIWRYCVLFERGGIYFDINKAVNVPLREIIRENDKAIISFEQNQLKDFVDWRAPFAAQQALNRPELIISNWGLPFAKGHPFLAKTIENIVNDYPIWKMKKAPNVKGAILRFTGPLMFTRSIWQAIEEYPAVDFRQAGIDFDWHGIFDMRGSWSRYAISASYSEYSNAVIVG